MGHPIAAFRDTLVIFSACGFITVTIPFLSVATIPSCAKSMMMRNLSALSDSFFLDRAILIAVANALFTPSSEYISVACIPNLFAISKTSPGPIILSTPSLNNLFNIFSASKGLL